MRIDIVKLLLICGVVLLAGCSTGPLREVRTARLPDVGLMAVDWSRDGTLLVTSNYRYVNVFDAGTLKTVSRWDHSGKGPEQDVKFSPHGRYLASARSATLWEVATGKPHVQLPLPPVKPAFPVVIDSLAFSPDGKMLVVTYKEEWVVKAYDVETGGLLWSYEPTPVLGRPRFNAPPVFAPDGSFVLLATGERGDGTTNFKQLSRILFLDARSGQLGRSIDDVHAATPTALSISRDGKIIASGTSTGMNISMLNSTSYEWVHLDVKDPVRLWDFDSGRMIVELPVDTRVSELAFSAGGEYLVGVLSVIPSQDPNVVVWSLRSGKVVQLFRHSSRPQGLVLSPDGKQFAMAGGKDLVVFDFLPGASH